MQNATVNFPKDNFKNQNSNAYTVDNGLKELKCFLFGQLTSLFL